MRKPLTLFLLIAGAFCSAGQVAAEKAAAAPQPVFIVLYSRFYDHSHPGFSKERIQRLIPLIEKLRAKYPAAGVSGLFEFSGSISQVLLETKMVDQVKEAAAKGLIDIGYTGEDEPSYLYRPKAQLLGADTPEKRWLAQSEAAERFLTDFKNPVTGRPLPVPGLSGGLKRMQEVFGEADFIQGLTGLLVGGDSATTHEVRKLNTRAMMMGIPASDVRRGIEAYGSSAAAFSTAISPLPNTSPEVFWEDGFLRLSSLSLTDNKPHTTDEPVDQLKRAFDKLDRSKVRVIALELGSYLRYLTKRADGSVVYDPMEWLYYHPDDPQFPTNMKPFVTNNESDKGYVNEEAVLKWLLDDYFPANPGSRFLSIHDLAKMAGPESPAEVDWNLVKSLASDFDAKFKEFPQRTSDYLRAGDRFFSNAEAFELMVEALAGIEKNGTPPATLKVTPISGPIMLPNDMGPFRGSVTVREVLHAAALLAPTLRNTEWKLIPDNAVPPFIQVGSAKVNSAQFLRLMASACFDYSPDKVLTLSPIETRSDLTFRYPRNTPNLDQGMGWTFKPAPLIQPNMN